MPLFKPVILVMALFLLVGCNNRHLRTEGSSQTDVFGIQLYSAIDYQEIRGVRATEEPCLRGYERRFDPLAITIGYGRNGTVRKIITRNVQTSIFSIKPGMPADEGRARAKLAGFTMNSPATFVRDDIVLSLLIDDRGVIFGITLEGSD